jgi:hypothetical protein
MLPPRELAMNYTKTSAASLANGTKLRDPEGVKQRKPRAQALGIPNKMPVALQGRSNLRRPYYSSNCGKLSLSSCHSGHSLIFLVPFTEFAASLWLT